MISLSCPKCRHGLADDALDAGHCPLCGFPLDGPVVLGSPAARGGTRWVFASGALSVLALVCVGYILLEQSRPVVAPATVGSVEAVLTADAPAAPVRQIAPYPHQPTGMVADLLGGGEEKPPIEPKRGGPRPVGVVMKVDPKIEPKRHFDHPDDTAALPDLNSDAHVTLTGRVRVLRIGSVNGNAVLDASGLEAEEVIVTGDLNNQSQVRVNAPRGKVIVGGYVTGATRLTVIAPGAEVTVAESGRVSGSASVLLTAKRIDVRCPLSGSAKLQVSLSLGGSLKLRLTEEGAIVTYRSEEANALPLTIEKGTISGGARVLEVK